MDETIFNKTVDYCLAKANLTSNDWSCVESNLTLLEDGFWSYALTDMGAYSVVLNPERLMPTDPNGGTTDEEGFFKKHLLWILLGGGLLLLLIVLVIILIIWCRRR